jgi:hypothetical protein
MPVGLKIPISVGSNGGMALVDGDENDMKIISLALGDGDNENAFMQDIALGQDMIFDIADATIRSQISGRVKRIFKDFQNQNRFKLLDNTMEWLYDDGDGTVTFRFRYLNIESDKINEFEKTYGSK